MFNREEGEGSAIFVARFIDNNNQEGVSGEPIAYVGASIVHRIGRGAGCRARRVVARNPRLASPLRASASGRREAREERQSEQSAGRRGAETERRRDVRAGAEQSSVQMVDKPWMAVDIPRAGAPMCSIGGPGTVSRCRRFLAAASTWRTRSSTGRAKSADASCSATRPTAA